MQTTLRQPKFRSKIRRKILISLSQALSRRLAGVAAAVAPPTINVSDAMMMAGLLGVK
jgi:hypothetical protein